MLRSRITRSMLKSADRNAVTTKKQVPKVSQSEVQSQYFTKKNETDMGKAPGKRKSVKIQYESSDDSTKIEVKKVKTEKWEPENWQTVWDNIVKMRKERDAPVDTMGCDKLTEEKASPQDKRYQVLLSLMLSSQTRDQVTSEAMRKLRRHGCNIEHILKTDDKIIGELIYPVGFWKKKIEYIKKTTKILKEKYNGDIPDTIEGLCSLPGVGPKMAYLVMKSAWDQVLGIGVDVHVHRISNRLRWVEKPTKEPEKTRKALEDWLPREKWHEINLLLVGFGQQTCLPVSPKCDICLNNHLCPIGRKGSKIKK